MTKPATPRTDAPIDLGSEIRRLLEQGDLSVQLYRSILRLTAVVVKRKAPLPPDSTWTQDAIDDLAHGFLESLIASGRKAQFVLDAGPDELSRRNAMQFLMTQHLQGLYRGTPKGKVAVRVKRALREHDAFVRVGGIQNRFRHFDLWALKEHSAKPPIQGSQDLLAGLPASPSDREDMTSDEIRAVLTRILNNAAAPVRLADLIRLVSGHLRILHEELAHENHDGTDQIDLPAGSCRAWEAGASLDIDSAARRVLATLTERQRRILHMRAFPDTAESGRDTGYVEIGRRLGISKTLAHNEIRSVGEVIQAAAAAIDEDRSVVLNRLLELLVREREEVEKLQ